MLTYQAPLDSPINTVKGQDKPWLLLLLCLFWLIPGLIGHDPWKPDENVSMAIVSYFMRHSDWSIASIAGVQHFNQAPLYFWVAALLANACRVDRDEALAVTFEDHVHGVARRAFDL